MAYTAAYEAYFEEIPMKMVNEAMKMIEDKLTKEEYRLALECMTGPAFAELVMKDGAPSWYVARGQKWNGEEYIYTVQLYNKDLEVVESATYKAAPGNSFAGYVRMDGYPIVPLFMIAVKAIRMGRSTA